MRSGFHGGSRLKHAPIRMSWLLLILAAAAAITWFPTWDEPYAEDDYLFLEAVDGKSPGELLQYFWREGVMDHHYRPLSDPLFFAFVETLFGRSAFGYHALLMLLHVFSGLFIYRVACLIRMHPWAGVAAALFYVTRDFSFPSFIWASGISDVGSAVLALASLRFFGHWCLDGLRRDRLLSIFFFVCSILTKETAIVVIGLYVLLFLALDHRKIIPAARRSGRPLFVRLAVAIWPFLAIGLPLAIAQFTGARFEEEYGRRLYMLSPGLHMIRTWPSYLLWSLVAIREQLPIRGVYLAVALIGGGAFVVALWRTVRAFASRRMVGGATGLVLFALVWFTVAIFPALLAPDRVLTNYLAIAAVGPALMLGAAFVAALRTQQVALRVLVGIVGTALLVAGPVVGHLKAADRLDSGGWVNLTKARRMAAVLEELATETLPNPATNARIIVLGALEYDLRVLGNPRGEQFGIQQVFASALRVRYGRTDIESLSLPGLSDATPEVLNIVLTVMHTEPQTTHVIDTSGETRDVSALVRGVIDRGGDHRALARALAEPS